MKEHLAPFQLRFLEKFSCTATTTPGFWISFLFVVRDGFFMSNFLVLPKYHKDH